VTTTDTIYLLLPELILVLAATLIYVAGAFWPERRGWSWLAAASLLMAGVALFLQVRMPVVRDTVFAAESAGGIFSGPIVVDLLSLVSRGLILAVGLLFIMLTARTAAETQEPEFMGSLLLLIAGLNLVAMANDLVIVFLGLEMVSIPTYVLLFLGSGHVQRYAAQRQEAGTKYFFLSILSSAILLYGFSFLYGVAGSTQLSTIFETLKNPTAEVSGMVMFSKLAMVLIFSGLGFRLTAVPFHFYAPDVYQGTTNPNAGLLAVMPKIAALLALVRIVMVAMPGMERVGWQLTLAMAIVTMTLGNLLALWQNNVRRLLAYSSIAHAGYMLIGLSVGFATAGGAESPTTIDGVGSTLFYLMVYSLATAGTFAAITFLGSAKKQIDTVEDLAGLAQTNPRTAAAVAIFMFSLAGLPPLAGFWGKFGLLTGALGVDSRAADLTNGLWPWFLMLSIVTVLNAAIAAAYYLRIVATMYFRPPLAVPAAQGGMGAAMAMFACAVLVVGTGLDPGPWQEGARRVSRAASETFRIQAAKIKKSAPTDAVADTRPIR
jgi:NADH-quinone oxidoreductase subunit N